MYRRNLIGALLGTTALAGCAGFTVSTAVQYAQAAAKAALALIPDLTSINVSATVTDAVQTAANVLSAAASALATTLSGSATQSVFQTISSSVLAIVAAVSPVVGLPAIITTVLQALQAIVPAIAQALGLLGVGAPRGAMSGDRAFGILQTYGATAGK